MKKITLLAVTLLLGLYGWSQALNETFDTATIPTGWSTQIVSGTADWTFGSGDMPTGTDFSTNAAIIDVDANGGAGLDEAFLISPILDTTTLLNGIELSFEYSLQDFAGDGDLDADVFDGTNWVNIFTVSVDTTPTVFPFTNMTAFSNANFQIRFRYDDDGAAATSVWGAGIDNVILRELPSCVQPTDLDATFVTENSAILSWISGGSGETTWDIELGIGGFTPTGTPTDVAVMNPFTASSLSPNTEYDYYVRADCGGGDASDFTGPFTFRTACVAVADFNENFDGVSTPDLPSCWSSIVIENVTGTDPQVQTSTSADNSAPNGARIYNGSGSLTTPNDAILISPQLNTLNLGAYRLRFFGDASPAGDVEVGTISDPTDPTTFNLIETVTLTTVHTEYIVSFDTYTGTDNYVAFRHPNTTTFDSIYLDNIIWEAIPSCVKPNTLTATNMTTTTADLSWVSGGSGESLYDVEIGLVGFIPTGNPTDAGVTNPFTATMLSASSTYDYYVRAACGPSDVSAYEGPFTFSTLCNAVSDFNENFDAVSTPDLPNCWSSIEIENATGTDPAVTTSTSADNSAPNGARLYNGSGDLTTPNDVFLVSPQLNTLSAGTHRLRFFADGSPAGDVEVGTITDPTDPTTFTLLQTVTFTTTHTQYIVSFDSYSGTDTYIAFRHPNTTTFDSIYLDDIVFETIPACLAPTDLTLISATDTAVTIGWTNNSTSSVSSVIYGIDGFDPLTSGTTVAGTSNMAMISGLTAETAYDFYVIQDCTAAGDGLSSQSGPLSITTPCSAVVAPYFVDFENFSAATSGFVNDQCWNEISSTIYDWAIDTSGGTTSSDTGPSGAFSGSTFMFVEASNGSTGDVATVLSPAIDLTALTVPSLSFYYHMYGSQITSLEVGVSTDNGATFTNELTITGQQQMDSTDPWLQSIIDLSAYTNQTVIVSFTTTKGTGTLDYEGDVSIDDVNFDELPVCNDVTAVTVDGVGSSSLSVSWTDNNSPVSTAWEVIAVPAGDPVPAIGTTNATMTSFTFSPLTPSTPYDIYVRADCATSFVGPLSATTNCAVIVPDTLETFDTFVPTCWSQADGGDLTTGPTNFGASQWFEEEFAHVGTGNGAVNINLYRNIVSDWIVSPLYDLSAGGYELNIDVAVTDYNSTAAGIMGSDDLVVLAYTLDGTTWTALRTWDVNNQPATAGETYTDALAGIAGTAVRFGIYATDGAIDDTGIDYDFHVDNFQLRTPPSCPDTSNLTLVSNTDTEATINFDSGNATSAGNYEYSVTTMAGTAPSVTGSWSDVAGAMPNVTYTIPNLMAETEYFVYVREVCAVGNVSAWSITPLNFTTNCAAVTTYPYITDFTTNVPNACWDEAGDGEIAAGPSGLGTSDWAAGRAYTNFSGVIVPSNVMNIYQTNTDREWLISEQFDMAGSSNDVLSIEVAVTDYAFSGTSTATDTATMDADDQVDLLITTDGGTTWSSLVTWNAANQPAVTGSRVNIDLSTYTGTVQFAFLASDGATGGVQDYDFHVGMFIIDGTAGNEDNIFTSLSLYPNPVNGDTVTITMGSANNNTLEIAIYNTLGQQVMTRTFNQVNNSITIDNISSLANGMYLVKVTDGSQQKTLKFIKE